MKKLFTGFLCLLVACRVMALDPNHFTINRITAPYFIVDGNLPTAINKAYVGFEIKNNSNSGQTYSGLKFTITSIGTTVVGQNYTLVSPANGIINVGTLAPGESRVCYYYVSYPASVTPQATFNVQLSDNSASWKTTSFNIRNRSSISANAGGTATQTFTNQDIIGGLVYDDVTYAVGNVQNGDESDFQVAVSSGFDPTKILLLGTQVTASTVPGINVGSTDSLYFITGNGSTGSSITIRYTFKISATNFTTYLLPCAGATSGSTNYKYALNTALGQGTPVTVSSTANPLQLTKTANKNFYSPGELAVFTVTISNPGAYGISIDRITDEIPSGFTFSSIDGTSQVTAVNSTTVPSNGNTGTVSFEGGVLTGLVNSYYIAAGSSLVLKYKATAPNYNAANLQARARAYVGTTEVGTASVTVGVSNTLPVTLLNFNGEWVGNQVRLSWITSNEYNAQHFEIEKSSSSDQFEKIGEVAASGFSSSNQFYTFLDPTAYGQKNRYRLRMVDMDGSSKYSPVISLDKGTGFSAGLKAFPNPFTENLSLCITLDEKQTVKIKMINTAGRMVSSGEYAFNKGQNYIKLQQAAGMAPGVYFVLAETKDDILTTRLIKN